MPDNSVLITFDDGYEDNYTNVLPILEKYDAKATVFLIGSYIGEKSGYLNWEQVQKMSESGHFNIESHTYNLHDLFLDGPNKGKTWLSEKLEEESDEEYFEKAGDFRVFRGQNSKYPRYLVGKFANNSDAQNKLNELKGLGYEDAFITKFKGAIH